MMDISGEDWLSDEKFDFNINLSKSSTDAGDDDEEVFIGPVTHKEKCVAALVQEQVEVYSAQRPNPREQALLLRESALIAVKIKGRGALGTTQREHNMSPVAVVHPMNREEITNEWASAENKENIPRNEMPQNVVSNKSSQNSEIYRSEDSAKIPSQLLKIGNQFMSMPVNNSSTNISGFVEPLHPPDNTFLSINHEENRENIPSSTETELSERKKEIPLNGLQKQMNICATKFRKSTNSTMFAPKRLSMLASRPGSGVTELVDPVVLPAESRNTSVSKASKIKQVIPKPSRISKSKSGGGIPSLLPSALPSRPRPNGGTLGIKPFKPSQSLSGISDELQEKSSNKVLGNGQPSKMSGRKCVSAGTPPINPKISVNSVQRLSSVGKKVSRGITTPGNGKKVYNKQPNSETKQINTITPVVKPSRKSIISRKLNSATNDRLNDESVHNDMCKRESLNVVNVVPVENQEIPPSNDMLEKYKNNYNPKAQEISNNGEPSSMINGIEKTCSNTTSDEKCKLGEVTQQNMLEKYKSNCNPKAQEMLPNKNGETSSVMNGNENTCSNITTSDEKCKLGEVTQQTITNGEMDLLIDVGCLETEITPVKLNTMDPFETGDTPPPLIELDLCLEPEKRAEFNLIEF